MNMFLGTQYYRPPNPEPEVWESDFAEMRRIGLEVVRTWLYWRRVQPAEDRWEWADYDRFFDLAQRHGRRVLVQLLPESPPEWFIRQHAALRPKDARGQDLALLGNGMVAIGGYPGLFYDHPEVAEGMAAFFRAAVGRYGKHPALFAWDVWNEIQPHVGVLSYDGVTTRRFQEYLAERYRTIERFNAALAQQFGAFGEVPMPPPEGPGIGSTMLRVLFEEFRGERLNREMVRRAKLIREGDPAHRVVSHGGSSVFHAAVNDDWRLAEPLDGWGTSHYRFECSEGPGNDYVEIAQEMAFVRSAAAGKPFWLSEHTGGQVYYHYGHHLNDGAETRSSILLALGHGAEAALYWQYRHERFGQEAPGWGLLNFDGSGNDRVAATEQIAGVLAREGRLLDAAKRPPAAVGLIYDPRVALFEQAVQQWVGQKVSMRDEFRGWYGACHAAGFSPDVYHPRQVAEGRVPPECRVLCLPMHAVGRPDLYAALLRWVEQGGVLVATAYLGTFDADGYTPRIMPLEPLAGAIGFRVLGRTYPAAVRLRLPGTGGRRGGKAAALALHGHWTHEQLRVDAARVVARCGGQPAVLCRTLGKGHLWYLATCAGIGFKEHGGDLPGWMAGLLAERGVRPWFQPRRGVLGELAAGPRGAVLYLANPTHTVVSVRVQGNARLNGRVRDLLGGKRLGVLSPSGTLAVSVPPRDTGWLAVERGE
jgi:beta-galactosidase